MADGDFSVSKPSNGLAKIRTQSSDHGICHDDSAAPVKAQTIDELHSLQKKRRSSPTTPVQKTQQQQQAFIAASEEEERHKQRLQSIR